MLKYLSDYIGTYEDQLNTKLITKEDDKPLEELVVDAWKSLEVLKNIKFLGYEFSRKESDIDINRHVYRRKMGVPKKSQYDTKLILDNRVGLLTVHLKITATEKDSKTGKNILKEKYINKDMLIPIADEDGFLFINGKKYYLIYQLVEKSTYTTLTSTVVKSLMPVVVKRMPVIYEDVDGTGYIMPHFKTFVFKRETDIMLFIVSRYGILEALSFLNVAYILRLVESLKDRKNDCLYFQVSSSCYIEVVKDLFIKYRYIQGIVAGLLEILPKKFSLDNINDVTPFIKNLTHGKNYEKGLETLTSFNRMLDETTKNILKVNDYHKENIYAVIRWVMMEFDNLRLKENMSLENKRLRCHEYIASLLTTEFSTRLNRIINLGNKATMDNIVDIFKFSGMILIQKMHASGVLRFDENINDMDFFSRLKYTVKGPHSAGRKTSKSISKKYRGLHPSYIGRIDMLTCGNSD